MLRKVCRRFTVLFLLLAAAVLVAAPLASAQAVSGTILGNVRDATGAVLPGVTVVVTNDATGLTRTLVTDAQGEFTAPSVPTGTYTVTAELSGFKKISRSNYRVGVDMRVRVEFVLELGAMTETVNIVAETPLVQTSSSELGTTVTQEQITAMPLNGRNFVNLTRIVPGVLRGIPGANIDGAGSLAWRASASFSANGQRPRDNNFMLDGVDNNETWLQTVVIFPSPDSLEEFKMQTSTYSAEFGRSLGGVVNLQIKSGTNTLRGSAFEFYRDEAFDANNWFNNRAGRPKADLSQHEFGGTMGGKILRDRTFFFLSYQGHREKRGQTFLSTVPTDAMRSGNFSAINRVIYDPTTGQPFPGNVIPSNRIDPVAKNILDQLYPSSNTTGTVNATGQTINNYLINPIKEREDNQIDTKFDHNLSQNNRFFVRYSYQKTHRLQPATLPHGDAGVTFGAGDGNIKARGLAINDTHTFRSSVLNEARFGWTAIDFFMTPIDYLQNPAKAVGIPGINLNDATSAMTQQVFQNIRNLGANGNQPLITNQNDFAFFDNVTWIKGKHSMKAGGNMTFRSREILNADTIVGQFFYTNGQTSNCAGQAAGCTINNSTGFDVASFLLGYTNQKTRNLFDAKTYTEKRPEYGLYFQDDFRPNSRLTINMGLRWDVYPPYIEVDNRQSNWDPATGKFVVASDDATINGVKVGRRLQTYSKRDLGPRFGFAWDSKGDGSLMVRGGFGIYWNYTPGGTSSSKAQNPPFLQSTALTTTPTNYGINLKTADGLPAPPGVDPSRPPAGSTRSVFDINFRDAFARQYNVNAQKSFGKNYMVEVAYVGSQGRNMLLKYGANEAPPVLGVTDSNINRPFYKVAPAVRDLGMVTSKGILNYNALQVKFQRRFANNFSFLNSYTYGSAKDYNSDNDGWMAVLGSYQDPSYWYGPSDYDIRHTFNSSWIYEFPWARAKWYGGWQVSGLLLVRGGLPMTVTTTQAMSSTGLGTGNAQANRPNQICSGELANRTVDKWFDTSCFVNVTETTATFGDEKRGALRGAGSFNIDMSLIKNTRIGPVQTEIRVEAFNLLNHPQFGNPNTTLGNSAYGTVTAMLSNPSCSLCGTVERQIQIGVKMRF
jgi:hypothetical protein